MAKITNGRVVAEVPDEKAAHYCLMTGFHLMEEAANVEIVEPPRPKRGRPSKKVQND
jgi:hypothetical protein